MSLASRPAPARQFAARARRQRLRRLLTGLGVAAAAVLIGFLAWLVGWSDVLAVKSVSVVGVSSARGEQVVAVAQAPVGTPLVRVDTGAIGDRVRSLPETGDVEVRRSWPSTLTIEVTPREPLAAVSAGDTWWSVDESGVLFDESGSQPESLPVLDGPARAADSAADSAADEATRAAGVAVLTRLPSALADLVETVQARSVADVRLELADGATVRWGTAERIGHKADVLLALINAQEEPPSGYDVSAPDHPAVIP